ncbi:SDR family oxidoreductase [Candidatus Woesearchaeota archaeon]|nr:SDR family oxidoreductase [Candidatus Woesearchaeota archaeon]
MSKVILITGCSSGIGLATAIFLAKQGNKVYASMRDLNRKGSLMAEAANAGVSVELLQLDVTDDNSVKKAAAQIIEKEGRIDVLINNSGYGLMGAAESVTIEEAKAEFEVNFFGLLRVTQAVLPHMRKQKSGHIINISSIAGIKAMPASDLYNASKFAVEGLTEAMAPTLRLLGIKTSLIEPGPVATKFVPSIRFGSRQAGKAEYAGAMEKMSASRRERFSSAQKPEEIAAIINEAITAKKPHLRYQTSDWVKNAAKDKLAELTGDSIVDSYMDTLKRE